ncbi:hypothetical protein C8Q80DRAFT_1116821 [Daedaleopsis nitida]|nr:hypothetical protein C8Q80DRAFT_1116821 [Daedaleopsis nitida]
MADVPLDNEVTDLDFCVHTLLPHLEPCTKCDTGLVSVPIMCQGIGQDENKGHWYEFGHSGWEGPSCRCSPELPGVPYRAQPRTACRERWVSFRSVHAEYPSIRKCPISDHKYAACKAPLVQRPAAVMPPPPLPIEPPAPPAPPDNEDAPRATRSRAAADRAMPNAPASSRSQSAASGPPTNNTSTRTRMSNASADMSRRSHSHQAERSYAVSISPLYENTLVANNVEEVRLTEDSVREQERARDERKTIWVHWWSMDYFSESQPASPTSSIAPLPSLFGDSSLAPVPSATLDLDPAPRGNSSRGGWPWKYVCDMHTGFVAMESFVRQGMLLNEAFELAFPGHNSPVCARVLLTSEDISSLPKKSLLDLLRKNFLVRTRRDMSMNFREPSELVRLIILQGLRVNWDRILKWSTSGPRMPKPTRGAKCRDWDVDEFVAQLVGKGLIRVPLGERLSIVPADNCLPGTPPPCNQLARTSSAATSSVYNCDHKRRKVADMIGPNGSPGPALLAHPPTSSPTPVGQAAQTEGLQDGLVSLHDDDGTDQDGEGETDAESALGDIPTAHSAITPAIVGPPSETNALDSPVAAPFSDKSHVLTPDAKAPAHPHQRTTDQQRQNGSHPATPEEHATPEVHMPDEPLPAMAKSQPASRGPGKSSSDYSDGISADELTEDDLHIDARDSLLQYAAEIAAAAARHEDFVGGHRMFPSESDSDAWWPDDNDWHGEGMVAGMGQDVRDSALRPDGLSILVPLSGMCLIYNTKRKMVFVTTNSFINALEEALGLLGRNVLINVGASIVGQLRYTHVASLNLQNYMDVLLPDHLIELRPLDPKTKDPALYDYQFALHFRLDKARKHIQPLDLQDDDDPMEAALGDDRSANPDPERRPRRGTQRQARTEAPEFTLKERMGAVISWLKTNYRTDPGVMDMWSEAGSNSPQNPVRLLSWIETTSKLHKLGKIVDEAAPPAAQRELISRYALGKFLRRGPVWIRQALCIHELMAMNVPLINGRVQYLFASGKKVGANARDMSDAGPKQEGEQSGAHDGEDEHSSDSDQQDADKGAASSDESTCEENREVISEEDEDGGSTSRREHTAVSGYSTTSDSGDCEEGDDSDSSASSRQEPAAHSVEGDASDDDEEEPSGAGGTDDDRSASRKVPEHPKTDDESSDCNEDESSDSVEDASSKSDSQADNDESSSSDDNESSSSDDNESSSSNDNESSSSNDDDSSKSGKEISQADADQKTGRTDVEEDTCSTTSSGGANTFSALPRGSLTVCSLEMMEVRKALARSGARGQDGTDDGNTSSDSDIPQMPTARPRYQPCRARNLSRSVSPSEPSGAAVAEDKLSAPARNSAGASVRPARTTSKSAWVPARVGLLRIEVPAQSTPDARG